MSEAGQAPSGASIESQSLFADGLTEPEAGAPVEHRLAWLLRVQSAACAAMGSPLYAHLLDQAAANADGGGSIARLLGGHVGDGRSDALALRFLAAVHRLVLTGRAPALARHYPSTGGDGDPVAAWSVLSRLADDDAEVLDELVRLPCQTNEVGRCAALAWGLLEVAGATGRPLRLLEVGSSAGLLLRFDRYHYGGDGVAWGPPDSPVDLDGMWAQAPPAGTDVEVEVAERRGCDPQPVSPTSREGQLALRSSVWADQTERLARLDGALEVAGEVPALVDRASVGAWLPQRLARAVPGMATVVFHSVVEEYLDARERDELHATVRAAGARASSEAPVAWLRLEPVSQLRQHGVRLTTWPSHGDAPRERLLAVCSGHGADVRRPDH
jgi:hypothetical protein